MMSHMRVWGRVRMGSPRVLGRQPGDDALFDLLLVGAAQREAAACEGHRGIQPGTSPATTTDNRRGEAVEAVPQG